MSLKPVTCNLLVCDGCGTNAQGYEDAYTIHFDGEEEARSWLAENEKDYEYGEAWLERDGKHYCETCLRNLPHSFVEGSLGRLHCYACDAPKDDPRHLTPAEPTEGPRG